MNGFTALDLARSQFAFTVAFHILFPSFSIGLAAYLAVLEGLWLRVMFSMAMGMIMVAAPLQIIAGDTQGLNTLRYQPAKIAAIEGDWTTRGRAVSAPCCADG